MPVHVSVCTWRVFCVCVRARLCVCVHACVRACVCVCVCARAHVCMDGQRGVCKLLWQDRGWILGRLATRAALFGLARCVGNAPCAREASIQWHAFACSMAHCATRLMCCCFDLGARTARRAAPVLRAASDTPAGLSWWSGARAACLNCPRSWGHGAYRRSPLRPLRPLSPPACAPAGTTSRSEAPTHWSASWMRRSGSCKSLPTSTCL